MSWLADHVDRLVVLEEPEVFWSVGACYSDFAQVEDEEVIRLLKLSQANDSHPEGSSYHE